MTDGGSDNSAAGPVAEGSTETVGLGDYAVRQGDCISSIAYENGFFWKTLWNHSDNAQLKQTRKDPNVLLEGDLVTIPPLTQKQETGQTTKRHQFKLKGVPAKLNIRLLANRKPRANEPYRLEIDRTLILSGSTDGDGWLRHSVPPNSRTGRLVLQKGNEFTLLLGHLDPYDQLKGVQARLNALGFDSGTVDGFDGPKTRTAVMAFQREYGLQVDGIAGVNTKAKLKEVFGC